MTDITVLLLNYKRPQNLPKIIDCLKAQTISPSIFLWDNSGDSSFNDDRLDLTFRTSNNQGCSPRWLMALYSQTKYIMTHDDDFLITENDILEKIVRTLDKEENDRTILGLEGIVLDKSKSYSQHIGYENRYRFRGNKYGAIIPRYGHIKQSERTHMVKGRLMAMRTESIKKYIDFQKLLSEREDDITVCSMIGQGQRIHLVPIFFKTCIEEIPEKDGQKVGNKDNSVHQSSRDIAFEKYFLKNNQYSHQLSTAKPLYQDASNSIQSTLQTKLDRKYSPDHSTRFILIAPFHNSDFLEMCMKSVEKQIYTNYLFVGIDDCSKQDYSSEVKRLERADKFLIIRNTQQQYALKSRVIGLDKVAYEYGGIDDEDVIVHLDGDDWFADEWSLSRLADAYSDGTLVTYGGAMRLQDGKLSEPFMHALSNSRIEKRWGRRAAPKYPDEVVAKRDYRNYPWGACHCRTFKYKLYKQIYRSDFLDNNGNYLRYATDMAIFIPILEMAGDKIKYINDLIYIYNRDTGQNNVASQFKDNHFNHNWIRSKERYSILLDCI